MLPSLQQAIDAIKAGDKVGGRAMLADILQVDYDNETAWLWLSSVVDSRAEKRRCLNRVLDINPDNEPAGKGLALLGPDPDAPAAVPAEIDTPADPLDSIGEAQPEPVDPPPSLKERLATVPPPARDKEVDVTLLEKHQAELLNETESEAIEAESPGTGELSQAGSEASDLGAAATASTLDRDDDDDEDEPEDIDSEEFDDDEDYVAVFGPDDDFDDLEDDEDRPLEPSFWHTERAALLLGGLVVFVLLCVGCIVFGLVVRPIVVELPATIEAAVGTATPTATPSPTSTATPSAHQHLYSRPPHAHRHAIAHGISGGGRYRHPYGHPHPPGNRRPRFQPQSGGERCVRR